MNNRGTLIGGTIGIVIAAIISVLLTLFVYNNVFPPAQSGAIAFLSGLALGGIGALIGAEIGENWWWRNHDR